MRVSRGKPLRILWWLLLLFVLVVLYAVGSYFLVPVLIKGPVAGAVSQRLDRPVDFSRVIFSPFSWQLILKDMRIGPETGDNLGPNLLEVAGLECRFSLAGIAERKIIWDKVIVEDPVLRVRSDPAANTVGSELLDLFAPARGEQSLWPGWLVPGEVSLSRGRAVYFHTAANREYVVEDIDLYLPPMSATPEAAGRLPRFAAKINDSAVEAEGVRFVNDQGRSETGFDLRLEDIVLAQYPEFFSFLQPDLAVTEGTGEARVRIILPLAGSGVEHLSVDGSIMLSQVKIGDSRNTVLASPTVEVDLQYQPFAGGRRFRQIRLVQPELWISAANGAIEPGTLTWSRGRDLLAAILATPAPLIIDHLAFNEGTVHVAGSGPEPVSWNKVVFSLDDFRSAGAADKQKSGPARYQLAAVAGAAGRAMKLAMAGEIGHDRKISGQLSLTGADFSRFPAGLSAGGLKIARGTGDILLEFTGKPAAGTAESGSETMRITGGRLSLFEPVFIAGSGKNLEAAAVTCSGIEADFSSREIFCRTVEVTAAVISDPVGLSRGLGLVEAAGNDWGFSLDTLRISRSRLHFDLLSALCSEERPLVLENFEFEGTDLKSGSKGVIRAAAEAGGGTLRVNGPYTPGGKGSLEFQVENMDLAYFAPCAAKVFKPEIRRGSLQLQGTMSVPEGVLTGQLGISGLAAGSENGVSVSWQLATTERLALHLNPLRLELGEVMVLKPVITAKDADVDDPGAAFLTDSPPAGVLIDRVTLDNGQISLPWPVLVPGYKPELTRVRGFLAQPGQAETAFSLTGSVDNKGEFSFQGAGSPAAADNYLLTVREMSLEPFSGFLVSYGLDVAAATASWQRGLHDSGQTVTTEIGIRGAAPAKDSELSLVLALLAGPGREMRLDWTTEAGGRKDSLLLVEMARRLQHQALRAAVSPDIILGETLPELAPLKDIDFPAGSAVLPDQSVLRGYGELLRQRPFLRLRIKGSAAEADRQALLQIMQQEADRLRREENHRREQKKAELAEQQLQKLQQVEDNGAQVEEEVMDSGELGPDLEPLPPVQVEVSQDMLMMLARQRVAAVRDYLVEQLGLDPGKIDIDEGQQMEASRVTITLAPDFRQTEGKTDEQRRDG